MKHSISTILLSVTVISTVAIGHLQAQVLPYQNPSLSADERATDLLGRLTLEQKVQLMQDGSAAIQELGIQRYNWWNEALHGSARSGLATVFPQAIGMAASFDPTLLQQVMSIASTEQRIKYVQARQQGYVRRYKGLTVWTPNINIFRDPRWGRGQETYGEDPYLTYQMGLAVVNGLQGTDEGKVFAGAGQGQWRPYDKLHACLKHYAVHSGPEYERHSFNATDLSLRDLSETYLYAFERLVRATDVHEVMCAYNAVDGKPCCGSDQYLTQILRREWGYQGIVVSDCGAINDFYALGTKKPNHQVFPGDAALASANAVLSGTDLECGSSYKNLPEAVKRGAIKESDIDVSVFRLLRDRFRLGEMDADSLVSWNHIPETELASAASAEVALQMARESMTLLQNRNHLLPLGAQYKNIVLLGPNAADSVVMWGNYNGTASHTSTVLEALQQSLAPGQTLTYYPVSHHVEPVCFQSCFADCHTTDGQPGFKASYWNGGKAEGEPAAQLMLTSPWQLSTGGNTVVAPGVELSGFVGQYESTYHATQSRRLQYNVFISGQGVLMVNNDTIGKFSAKHGGRAFISSFDVEAEHDYQIRLVYDAPKQGEAQLNFNLGEMTPVDLDKLMADTRSADLYIYVGGISPLLEGEEMKVPYEGFMGGDRTNIQLPAIQRLTLQRLHQSGKPVVFVNMSGSAMGLVPEVESCDAILQAWYGGQAGGQAIVDVLVGRYNPAGRLPLTFYSSDDELPDYRDYNVKGHTYRYYQGKAVFPFGHGLSYTTFAYGKPSYKNGIVNVAVSNTGRLDGEEVVQVYLKRNDDIEGPIKALRGFARVRVGAGQTVNVAIPIDDLRTYNPATGRLGFVPGQYTIMVGGSSADEALQSIVVKIKKG